MHKKQRNKMRAIIQRVTSASVTVNGKVISKIENGICALIGIHVDDTDMDMDYIVKKLLNINLWDCPETNKFWKQSVMDKQLDVLCVSQFTLYKSKKGGNKPDFRYAMSSDK